jgi:hypothetical protein
MSGENWPKMRSLARGVTNLLTLGVKERVEDALESRRESKAFRDGVKRRDRLRTAYTVSNNLDNQHFEEGRRARNSADSAERKLNEHLQKLQGRSRVGLRARRITGELESAAAAKKIEYDKQQVEILKRLEESILLERKGVEKDIKEAQRKGKTLSGTANGNNFHISRILKDRGNLGYLGLKTSHGGVKRTMKRPVKRVVKRVIKRVKRPVRYVRAL